MVTIWGKLKGHKPEKIDQCEKRSALYLVGEYQLAFGKDWIIWAGRKKDEPKECWLVTAERRWT